MCKNKEEQPNNKAKTKGATKMKMKINITNTEKTQATLNEIQGRAENALQCERPAGHRRISP